jgi:RsiW-degrading membrane proteinase PrsW (M82 family)
MAFLILVVKGEGRGLIIACIAGMSGGAATYYLSFLFSDALMTGNQKVVFLFPVIEETFKIVPLLFMAFKAKGVLKVSLTRYAMAIGIGFSILENSMYLTFVEEAGDMMPLFFIIIRALTTSLLHGSTCALCAWSIQVMKQKEFKSPALFAGFFLGAVAIHGLYNLLWVSGKIAVLAILLPIGLFSLLLFFVNAFNLTFPKPSVKRTAS